MKSLLATMKTMGHEALAHDLFFDCFPELGSVLQMGGMKTTSLFRMALLYFLFVPDARERLLIRREDCRHEEDETRRHTAIM